MLASSHRTPMPMEPPALTCMGPWSQFSHLPQAENRSKPNPLRAALYESGLELGMGKVYKVHPEWLELGSIFDLRLDLLNLFIKFHWFPTNDRKNKLNNRIVAQGWCIYCYFLDLDLMTYQNNPTSLWVSCIIYIYASFHTSWCSCMKNTTTASWHHNSIQDIYTCGYIIYIYIHAYHDFANDIRRVGAVHVAPCSTWTCEGIPWTRSQEWQVSPKIHWRLRPLMLGWPITIVEIRKHCSRMFQNIVEHICTCMLMQIAIGILLALNPIANSVLPIRSTLVCTICWQKLRALAG